MRAIRQNISEKLLIGRIESPVTWPRWAEARALLHPALMRSDEDWPEIETELATEGMQLWVVLDGNAMLAAAVTRIAQTRGGEVVEIFLVGGAGYARWIGPLNDEIEEQSRDIGCVAMRAWGRKGWTNILADLGWKAGAVAYEKALV